MASRHVQVFSLVETQLFFLIVSAVVVVEEEVVVRGDGGDTRGIVVRTCPNLEHDVLGEGVLEKFYQVIIIYHVESVFVVEILLE